MPSFGEKLKKERERRSITLEQISLSTKIGTRMLQALEDGRFSQLPGGIFNKGFVRAYARFVGLDEDQAVADYLEASGETPPPQPEEAAEARPVVIDSGPASPPSKPLPWGLFAAILLVVALVLSVWSRRQHSPAHTATPTPTNEKSSTTPPTPLPTSQVQPTSTGPEVLTKAEAPKAEPGAKPQPVPATTSQPPVTPPKPTASGPTTTAPAPQPGEFTVVILARGDSWISIKADTKATFTETMSAGDQRAIHARDRILLKTGNTGALDFLFNGKKLPPQGELGQVKTLTFGSEGLQPATPADPAIQ